MNNVTIKINTENAAFEENPENEIIRILEEVIRDLRNKNLRDINGNTCGFVEIE